MKELLLWLDGCQVNGEFRCFRCVQRQVTDNKRVRRPPLETGRRELRVRDPNAQSCVQVGRTDPGTTAMSVQR